MWALNYLEKSLQEKTARIESLEGECKGLRQVIGRLGKENREFRKERDTLAALCGRENIEKVIVMWQIEILEQFLEKHGTPANRLKEEIAALHRKIEGEDNE